MIATQELLNANGALIDIYLADQLFTSSVSVRAKSVPERWN